MTLFTIPLFFMYGIASDLAVSFSFSFLIYQSHSHFQSRGKMACVIFNFLKPVQPVWLEASFQCMIYDDDELRYGLSRSLMQHLSALHRKVDRIHHVHH